MARLTADLPHLKGRGQDPQAEDRNVAHAKKLFVGLAMTALSVAAIFAAVRAFAPDAVKSAFRV